jgi:hypothetical protein
MRHLPLALLLLALPGIGAAPARAATPAQQAQQAKMKTCSAEAKAKDLHKADRKAFMKTCLAKSA